VLESAGSQASVGQPLTPALSHVAGEGGGEGLIPVVSR